MSSTTGEAAGAADVAAGRRWVRRRVTHAVLLAPAAPVEACSASCRGVVAGPLLACLVASCSLWGDVAWQWLGQRWG